MTDRPTEDDYESAAPPKITDHSLSDLRDAKDSALGVAMERLIREVESTTEHYAAFDSAA
jgi:FXSXX-COOH protein